MKIYLLLDYGYDGPLYKGTFTTKEAALAYYHAQNPLDFVCPPEIMELSLEGDEFNETEHWEVD